MTPDVGLRHALAEEAEPVDAARRPREGHPQRVRPRLPQLPVGEAADLRCGRDEPARRAAGARIVAAGSVGAGALEARRPERRLVEAGRAEHVLLQRFLVGRAVLPRGQPAREPVARVGMRPRGVERDEPFDRRQLGDRRAERVVAFSEAARSPISPP